MSGSLSGIRSAAVDGRLLNPIFRKAQLQRLHQTLSDGKAQIQAAIARDTGNTKTEVAAEYLLGMQQVKAAYDALDPEASLKAEYRLANGLDVPDGREPVGIVVLHVARHAFFFSLLSAMAPALSAGNCIIVKAESDMLEAPKLILELITGALDSDIFFATRDELTGEAIGCRHVTVLQNGSTQPASPPPASVVSDPTQRVVAIVERDADLRRAAHALVRARFSLRGRSPYAPDVVFVNEWVKKKFLAACIEEAVRLAPDHHHGEAVRSDRPAGSKRVQERLAHDRHVSIISTSATGTIVEVTDPENASVCGSKVEERLLIVHAVKSMDAAIDFANRNGALGAAYVFAQPAAAKYTCQFLNSPLSIVNDVPAKLLFHPMAPGGLAAYQKAFVPYDELLFSLPKAQFINRPSKYDDLETALSLGKSELLESLSQAASHVKPFRRAHGRPDIGFFEQGIVTGGVMLLSTIITVTGVCCYYWIGMPHGFLRRG